MRRLPAMMMRMVKSPGFFFVGEEEVFVKELPPDDNDMLMNIIHGIFLP
jgi:hypothetical protein